jgi:hypothetical protein
MIPTRSRLARSWSFQAVVDRDQVAAGPRRFRGGTKSPLGNRVKQVVSQTVLAFDATVGCQMQASLQVVLFLG